MSPRRPARLPVSPGREVRIRTDGGYADVLLNGHVLMISRFGHDGARLGTRAYSVSERARALIHDGRGWNAGLLLAVIKNRI